MIKKWKNGEEPSTLEEIMAAIQRLPHPVGIMLIGADCSVKHEVLEEILDQLDSSEWDFGSYGESNSDRLKNVLGNGRSLVLTLNSRESASRGHRHQCVGYLRHCGAARVVGAYVELNQLDWSEDDQQRAQSNAVAKTVFDEAVDSLRQLPPNQDGLDMLITATPV